MEAMTRPIAQSHLALLTKAVGVGRCQGAVLAEVKRFCPETGRSGSPGSQPWPGRRQRVPRLCVHGQGNIFWTGASGGRKRGAGSPALPALAHPTCSPMMLGLERPKGISSLASFSLTDGAGLWSRRDLPVSGCAGFRCPCPGAPCISTPLPSNEAVLCCMT